MSDAEINLEHFRLPQEVILAPDFKAAVRYFDLTEENEFLNDLMLSSSLNHENIVAFVGYYAEEDSDNMSIFTEYPENGCLDDHIEDLDKRSCLTWTHRLKICLDAARGLNYLHSGLGEVGKVVHGCVIPANIFLDGDMNAKIGYFQFSAFIPGNQSRQHVYIPATCDLKHVDPIYLATGFLKAETDVYAFGMLLFRVLTSTWECAEVYTGDLHKPESLTMLIQHYCDNRLDKLIDPVIRDQIGRPSFHMIHELTCKCISYNLKDRPTMDTIVKTIEEALVIHNQEAVSAKGSEYQNPRKSQMPSEEIKLATRNFSPESLLRHGINGETYIGQLSERWQNRTAVIKTYNILNAFMFHNELDISRLRHEHIIPYIGFCEEDNKKIIVYEHATNGSLRDHLQDPDKLRCLAWEQRLKICLGAARGLKCLHSGLWDNNRVVHRHVRSEFIMLDENMEAKISEFSLSMIVTRNKPEVPDDWRMWNLKYDFKDYEKFMDPIYRESYMVNMEVDVYSFGVIMFEILSGLMAYERTSVKDDDVNANEDADYASEDENNPNLIKQVHRYYGCDELDRLVDPNIRDQINAHALCTFAETAYGCLSYDIRERPSMNRIIKRIEEALYFQNHNGATDSTTTIGSHPYQKLKDLLIPLKEIKMATIDFSENSKIGNGGFGMVYKGQLSERWPNHLVAIKRSDKTGRQGKTEFLNELELISRFHHRNIIRFIGYCDEGDEMILVYEYACKGSLDHHLQDPNKRRRLTWVKRLKICLGAAKGLEYLHSGLGENNKVIHRDVKSGNILLDDNLEAKICDFGFSKSNSGNSHQQQSKVYTNAAGTNYYIDPIYHESGILRTESDVYSFGVVLFEILSGMPAWYRRRLGKDKPQPLINLVRRYYDYGKHMLIDPKIKDQIDNSSFQTFIEIAHQCISFNSKERPTMETIIDKIEESLDYQVQHVLSKEQR